jgi:nitrite reductase (NADH) large subunit
LKVAGVDVASMGLKGPELPDDEFVQFSEPRHGIYKTIVIRDGKQVGATLVGDVSKVSFLTQAFDSGLALPEERVSLMFDIGTPDVAVGVAELADDAQVCNCNGVSKGALAACVAGGETSLSGVMAKTKAGKGCGSCKELVSQIVEWAAGGNIAEDPSANWYVPGVPYAKPELMRLIRELQLHSVSSVFAALTPDGKPDAGSKMGLSSLLEMMWGDEFIDESDARFINDRVHANIQRDGTFSVVPQMKGGVTNTWQLRRIADVADKYQVPLIKLTGGQRIDLLGIKKEDLPGVWADLDMPSGYAYGKSFRTVKTCVGSDFCRFGVGDSTALGIAIEERFQGLASPAKMKLAVTGCPRNCAEALCKDLGVVAIEGGDGGRWEIYVGGAAGAHIRKGDLLATVDSPGEVMTLTGRFLQYYRENANWLERTYAWVPRLGIDKIRAVVVDDAEGIAADLDAAMEKSVGAYRDPWLDGRTPVTEGQFRSSLPLLPLPQVPVR